MFEAEQASAPQRRRKAGACLIYGVSNQAAARTVNTLVAEGKHPLAPDASRIAA